jgi:hypothetical protein
MGGTRCASHFYLCAEHERWTKQKLIEQCSTVTRQVLGFKGDVFGALDSGVLLEEVVVAIGEVGAVVAAAGFFAG